MFWSGNYIVLRELNSLLKEENVSLAQVLEADDILQECKADNKALIQFLTKPEILAELVTLITEEPSPDVELASQYRHASVACEVLTSQLSMLSDRLSSDAVQMNRLCDFINKDPPLNPLLASYFSKTVEMLLERSPKQDCYLYHIVCLRVLDFFRSRRDFLPNLLRHIGTSAIADTFKYFIRLDDLFNKVVMEWLDEHQFLESLIAIICGTYEPGADGSEGAGPDGGERAAAGAGAGEAGADDNTEAPPPTAPPAAPAPPAAAPASPPPAEPAPPPPADAGGAQAGAGGEAARGRRRAVAAANASALLTDIILYGCVGEGCGSRLSRTGCALVSRFTAAGGGAARTLLGAVFTSPARARGTALLHGVPVLRALRHDQASTAGGAESKAARTAVELAIAPHLPLLHQALLQPPDTYHYAPPAPPPPADAPPDAARASPPVPPPPPRHAVGAARLQVATLLAELAASEVQEVPTTMITLGTPGVLIDMFFEHHENSFLHAQVYKLVELALANPYRAQYADHLILECDLLNRLMDVYEENENKKGTGQPRSAHMGHVIELLGYLQSCLDLAMEPPPPLQARFTAFCEDRLRPVLLQHYNPLGGYYPSDNTFEIDNMAETLEANYDFNDMAAEAAPGMEELADDINTDDYYRETNTEFSEAMRSKDNFLKLASNRFDDNMWDDQDPGELPSVEDALRGESPWNSAPTAATDEDWAQFNSEVFGASPTPAAAAPAAAGAAGAGAGAGAGAAGEFWGSWGEEGRNTEASSSNELEHSLSRMQLETTHSPEQQQQQTQQQQQQQMDDASTVELANKLLTAMSTMTPEVIANIVNANMSEATPMLDLSDAPPPPPAPLAPSRADPPPTSADQITTGADQITTSADQIPTGSDRIPTRADQIPTSAVQIPTGADQIPTSDNLIPTGADQIPTGADQIPAGADQIPNGAEHMPSGSDQLPTSVDQLPISADPNPTDADPLSSGADTPPISTDPLSSGADTPPISADPLGDAER